jgi:hypothetical protein
MHTRKILDAMHRRDVLHLWTIYNHPSDFPHSYVARRFECGGGGGEPRVTDDIVQGELSILREGFRHAGLVCLTRNEDDDPNIVETWL